MFNYIKKLQYPINIKHCDPQAASLIISQYGGPDGELGASLRYLSQRFSMPLPELKGLLTDIGTEELGHLEMIGTIVHQLTKNLTEKEIEENPGFASYFVDHTTGVYPTGRKRLSVERGFYAVHRRPYCGLKRKPCCRAESKENL